MPDQSSEPDYFAGSVPPAKARSVADDLARERHLPLRDGSSEPTDERFLPPRRSGRPQRDGPGDGWYAADEESELLAPGGPVGRTPPTGQADLAGGGARRPRRAAEAPDGGPAGAGEGPGSAGSQKGAEAVAGSAESADGGAAGPELARAVLDAALAKRRDNTRMPRRRPGSGEGSGRRLRGYSGPGPDPRDPQLFGDMLQRLMKSRGWEKPKAEATVFSNWERVVGPDIAQHSRPVKLEGGVLTVEAESTAWATQLRLLASGLLKTIAGEVGHNVVTRLNIHGPAAPSWSKGPRRVQGRGPRDTYG